MKRLLVGMCLMSLIFTNHLPIFDLNTALAAAPGSVVINEVAWAGTADSSTDEWIELYNTTSSPIDLTGWTIVDDNGDAVYVIASGMVAGNGYFLIEDSEETTSIPANAVINISLANTGDSLVLKDNLGAVIDTVNSTGGMWFAGNSTTKTTMERIDPLSDGDTVANWGANLLSSGA
ncbi:lamin tail domain-containing protein, partial [Candidatus Peregrinibacteria bacterium]|nr:lamin tail domain-containing protein [Candidatus Peregrinibacteria bacterium]